MGIHWDTKWEMFTGNFHGHIGWRRERKVLFFLNCLFISQNAGRQTPFFLPNHENDAQDGSLQGVSEYAVCCTVVVELWEEFPIRGML